MDLLATFETDKPHRYMEQLCHHFGRKVPAQYDADSGWVAFSFGRCDMTAESQKLTLRANAKDQSQLDQVVQVMTSHLERFAFRENPTLAWNKPAA